MRSLKFLWMVLLGFSLMLSCGKRDDRDDIRAQYGEPDEVQVRGRDIAYSEVWFYYSFGQGFEFRRTAGCGSYQDTYLYAPFYFTPVSDTGAVALQTPGSLKHRLSTKPPSLSPSDGIFAPR